MAVPQIQRTVSLRKWCCLGALGTLDVIILRGAATAKGSSESLHLRAVHGWVGQRLSLHSKRLLNQLVISQVDAALQMLKLTCKIKKMEFPKRETKKLDLAFQPSQNKPRQDFAKSRSTPGVDAPGPTAGCKP